MMTKVPVITVAGVVVTALAVTTGVVKGAVDTGGVSITDDSIVPVGASIISVRSKSMLTVAGNAEVVILSVTYRLAYYQYSLNIIMYHCFDIKQYQTSL